MSTVACLGQGTSDRIESGNDGGILVTHNEGRLFLVAPDGGVTTLFDTAALRMNLADFEYVTGRNMVIFPTFTDRRVAAFRLGK